jgi:hypothetical protein
MAALHGGLALSLLVHTRLRVAIGLTPVLAVMGLLAAPSVAFASCPPQPLTNPFAQWGDTNNYFPVPGGTFEGTADEVGWSLWGASLTSENEPWLVNSITDGQSLTIAGGGKATSPFFCVDNTMKSLRFFAQQVSAGGDLSVRAIVRSVTGVTNVPVADLPDGPTGSWAPTASIPGDTSGLADGQTIMVALKFSVPASAGSWQIDDIYVDPYRSG